MKEWYVKKKNKEEIIPDSAKQYASMIFNND